jgi:hypothetical protein
LGEEWILPLVQGGKILNDGWRISLMSQAHGLGSQIFEKKHRQLKRYAIESDLPTSSQLRPSNTRNPRTNVTTEWIFDAKPTPRSKFYSAR